MVIAEHNNEVLSAATQNTLSAAKKIGGDISVLVAGTKCGPVSVILNINIICVRTLLKYYQSASNSPVVRTNRPTDRCFNFIYLYTLIKVKFSIFNF